MKDQEKEIIKNTLLHRISILQQALYVNKSYADEDTRAFWEGKLSAYQDVYHLLNSKIESLVLV